MIDNLIHTVSKENKTSQFGSLQASNSKKENGLDGQFRALFQSLNSDSEISEDSQTNQELVDENDVTDTKMNVSSDAVMESDSDSEASKSVEIEKIIDQISADQKTESAQESSDTAKKPVIDESIPETDISRIKVESGSTEMKEVDVSESIDQEVPDNSNPESKNEAEAVQDLSKLNAELDTIREKSRPEVSQSLDEPNSEKENFRSEISGKDQIHRESQSEIKESLSESVLKVDSSKSDKAETENRTDAKESRSALNVQSHNETELSKGSAASVSLGDDKPDQESRIENPGGKQESSAGLSEKGEPEALKSESNEVRNLINVDEGSNTTRKNGEGLGTTLQSEGSSNGLMNQGEDKEPVLKTNQQEQSGGKDNHTSTDLRRFEVSAQGSQEGDPARENFQSTERVVNRIQPFKTLSIGATQNIGATLNNGATQNQGATLNNSETLQNSDTTERLVDRFIHENLEKPIRIAQNPVESTVLIQDKVQPKRERNDVLFLSNNESKESSRLSIPGIGAESVKQNTSFNSGQFSDNFSGLSEAEKNEILWKEHTAESAESDELNRSELSAAALAKLGDSTLSNHFLRRVLLPGLTQTVFTASNQSDRTENWQRHNFLLEDGSKVQLSARKVDGVLQIKLGASIGELSKLLQIHQNEIREHLEKECNIKIDLQFDQGSGDQDQSSLDDFFGESTKKPAFEGGFEAGNQAKRNVNKKLHSVVTRNFGYNSKEWTA